MKWTFAPKTFNQLIKKHNEQKIAKLHNDIVTVVLAHTKGKTYTSKRWSLNGLIIDSFERFELKITRTTPDKWRRRILANDATKIDDQINWSDSKRFIDLGINKDFLPQIRRSTKWIDRYISTKKNQEILGETYRYSKWANYVLTYMGSDLLDYDLWVIAKAFERRDIEGDDTKDLEDWIEYAPYRADKEEKVYLKAIAAGKATKLKVYEFDLELTAAVARYSDEKFQELMKDTEDADSTEYLFARTHVSNRLFMLPTLIDSLANETKETEFIQYQLPSSALTQWNNKTIDIGTPVYFEMDIAEEVENIKSSLKSSLKAYKGTGLISNYKNNRCITIPSHLRTSVAA